MAGLCIFKELSTKFDLAILFHLVAMRSLTHAALPTAILVGLFSDFSLALTIPVIPHSSQTAVHNSSRIPSAVASTTTSAYPPYRTGDVGKISPIWVEPGVSPPPTDSIITVISPSTSTVSLPGHTGPPVPTWVPVDIVPGGSLSPGYVAQLVRTGKFSGFFKNLYPRDAPPEDVKIVDTKGPQVPITTVNVNDILIIDRKGPNPIPNATPLPVLPPGLSIEDIVIIDRKGPNPISNPPVAPVPVPAAGLNADDFRIIDRTPPVANSNPGFVSIPDPNSEPKPRAKRYMHFPEPGSEPYLNLIRPIAPRPGELPGGYRLRTPIEPNFFDSKDPKNGKKNPKSGEKNPKNGEKDSKQKTTATSTTSTAPSPKPLAKRFRADLPLNVGSTSPKIPDPIKFEIINSVHEPLVGLEARAFKDIPPLEAPTFKEIPPLEARTFKEIPPLVNIKKIDDDDDDSLTPTATPTPKPLAKRFRAATASPSPKPLLAKRYQHLPDPAFPGLYNPSIPHRASPVDNFSPAGDVKRPVKWVEPGFFDTTGDKLPKNPKIEPKGM